MSCDLCKTGETEGRTECWDNGNTKTLNICYELNVYVPPEFICLNPNPQ